MYSDQSNLNCRSVQMNVRFAPSRHPLRLIASFFNAIPTYYLILAIILCILSTEQQIRANSAEIDEWYTRQFRAPKFIRFGRAGQKTIGFVRSSSAEPQYSGGINQLDELVDAVDKLYQFSPTELRAFKTSPKRAQKFIRFG